MKSPEQPHKQEGETTNSPEGKEGLRLTIQTLEEVAKQFRVLDSEADILLVKDAVGYTEKLKARAQLLIDLPDRLASSLGGVDLETK
jgi:hypothetical protein